MYKWKKGSKTTSYKNLFFQVIKEFKATTYPPPRTKTYIIKQLPGYFSDHKMKLLAKNIEYKLRISVQQDPRYTGWKKKASEEN